MSTMFPENVSIQLRYQSNMSEGIVDSKQNTNAAQLPAKPKTKRIRKQKQELEYLRKLVGNLEEQMSKLKEKQPQHKKQVAVTTNTPSIWKGIAERQQKERTRVEEKNQQLRSSLEGQLKLAMKLEGLLRKRPREEEIVNLTESKRSKPSVSAATDDEIFADQLAHVLRAHLEVDKIFTEPEFSDPRISFCDLQVMNDSHSDTGVAFVKRARSTLPFDIQVSERAFWRALAVEGTKSDSYFLDERVTAENVVAYSYGLNFKAGQFEANVLGKQTYRKYVGDDYVVIMWKWVVDPVEVNGTTFCGMRCHETGWIMLRGVSLAGADNNDSFRTLNDTRPITSTQLQSYSKMTMELQDDVVNQELQIGALTDFVVNLHDTITEICGRMISKVLVEEDWNLNGWFSTMLP